MEKITGISHWRQHDGWRLDIISRYENGAGVVRKFTFPNEGDATVEHEDIAPPPSWKQIDKTEWSGCCC